MIALITALNIAFIFVIYICFEILYKKDSEFVIKNKHLSYQKIDKMYSELIDLQKPKSKKIIKIKSINQNIKDPITGETLDIVVCYCGTTYHKDTFNLYGCDCESKTINTK